MANRDRQAKRSPHSSEAEAATSKTTSPKKAQQPWNGHDYYVSFGVGETRTWEDARRYGFISAGGGQWYIQTLHQLAPSKRVFVHIPGEGYVGMGEVTGPVQTLERFTVDVDGQMVPILNAPHTAPAMDKYAGDPEKV